MLKIKKRHLKDASKIYSKNEESFMKEIHFFKNIPEWERIEVLAEMLAGCDGRMKQFKKKYPGGFPEIKEIKCELEEINWSSN